MPWADVMYGCDDRWWHHYEGVPEFAGEKWSSHGDAQQNDKREVAKKYGVNLVRGRMAEGFSYDPEMLHYGDNSGFQTLNLAILMGADYIVMVGYNLSRPNGKQHFFGDHPPGLFNQDNFEQWAKHFDKAAETLPEHIKIINSTWPSAINSFEWMPLEQAIENHRLHRHRTVADGQPG